MMKTILEILTLSTSYLKENGILSPKREAEQLIADALGMNRILLYLEYDRPLNEEEIGKCRNYIYRRSKKEPSQYIHGSLEFFDCTIKINPHVLIPRQETEILVDKISKYLDSYPTLREKNLWDVCCGSGCIGIALKKRFPELNVILSDISQDALNVVKENALINKVDVTLLKGNLLEPFYGQKADFIVSNPPYIKESDYSSLENEVRDFEPKLALVSGETGLEFYEYFSKNIKNFLNSPSKCWFEIGAEQGMLVKELFKDKGFDKICIEQDWSGNDRFFFLEKD